MSPTNPRFVNKELSWLAFNARVLHEAEDPSVPLVERIRFLGIYSSNLDEFFRVRVATLNRFVKLGKKAKKILGLNPKKTLKEIQEVVLAQNRKFDRIFRQVLKDLAKENIFIINERQLNEKQKIFVKSYFQNEVRPKLIPIMIDQVTDFPELRDRSIYLAVSLLKTGSSQRPKYALIEIPTELLPRFLALPNIDGKKYIILLDDVIRYGLSDIFSFFRFDRFDASSVKLTRDAELDIDDDLSQSYIRKVEKSLKLRKGGVLVSFTYDSQISPAMINYFRGKLNLKKSDTIIPGARYLDFKDFMDFPDIGLKRLKFKKIEFLPHRETEKGKELFEIMRKKDILFHYPYQSFHYVIDLLREASIDPKVTSIKITLYRVAKHSSIVHALINAIKNGKTVIVIMELQARFDEEANIYWAERLQEEGARVIYGVPRLKVHSKLCLISRQEKGKTAHYGIVGTGNFNEDTAKVYSDHNLFTSDKRITSEAKRVFDFYQDNYKTTTFKHLLVSPFNLRKRILKLIQTEIKNAQGGKEAYIILKLNNLVDTAIIRKLYQASSAGVDIRLIIRSMFSLIPGVPGVSENIKAINIVDRFLEHSRIFVFCNDGNEKYFISSADLMSRNLDCRVEVTCPIYDKDIQQELKTFLEIQWSDNIKARIRGKSLSRLTPRKRSSIKIRAQSEIYKFLKSQLTEPDISSTQSRVSSANEKIILNGKR